MFNRRSSYSSLNSFNWSSASITLFIVIVFGLVIGNAVYSVLVGNGSVRQEAAEWALEMGMQDPRVECVNFDTDGDGYVSCTVMSGGKLYALECAGQMSLFNSGCRVQKAVGIFRR